MHGGVGAHLQPQDRRPTQHAWDRTLPSRRAINQNTVWVLNGSRPIYRSMMMKMPRTGSMWQGGTKGAR